MNNNNRKIKNKPQKTAGKYALKGIRLAGLGVLTTTEIASKKIKSVARNEEARKLISRGLIIASTVAFPVPMIMMSGIGVMLHSALGNESGSAIDAALAAPKAITKVLDTVLDVAAVPTEVIAMGTEAISREGKKAIKKQMQKSKLDESAEIGG